MLLITLGFFCGVALGVRFNALILVPVIPAAWVLVAINGHTAGASTAGIVLEMILAAVVLQIGYMAGIGLQLALHSLHRVWRPWSGKPAVAPDRLF